MTNQEILKQFCVDAKSLVEKTKIAKDTDFLLYLFNKLNKNEIDIIPCLNVLGAAYSVARTTAIKTKSDRLCELLGAARPLFSQYDITSSHPVSDDLIRLFSDKTCGSRVDGNTIVSLISKYGYFITGRRFPIFDNFARDTLFMVLSKFDIKYGQKNDEIVFFNNYARLLNLLSVDVSFIQYTDAFLWLYGNMRSLEDRASTNTDVDWWNKTCGFLGTPEFLNWYIKVKKFLTNCNE